MGFFSKILAKLGIGCDEAAAAPAPTAAPVALGAAPAAPPPPKAVALVDVVAQLEQRAAAKLYHAKGSAENGIASVQSNCGADGRYEKKVASNGKHYFNLKAANHQVIGTSQMYASADSRDAGIASVKSNGTSTTVKDNT